MYCPMLTKYLVPFVMRDTKWNVLALTHRTSKNAWKIWFVLPHMPDRIVSIQSYREWWFEICPEIINISDGMLFNPFEGNEDQYYKPLYETDPDFNYYNSIRSHLGTYYNYHCEDHFETALKANSIHIKTGNIRSIWHLIIRSMRANLSSFEICLNNMNYNFSVIGLSENWFCDYNCNLYDIENYTFTEYHWTERAGAGLVYLLRMM